MWNENPLSGYKAAQLSYNVGYWLKQAFLSGYVSVKYTAHSCRHHFAVRFYNETKDVFELSRRLNHANIATTNCYLASLRKEGVGYVIKEGN
jgi:site-specific recombinase XerD